MISARQEVTTEEKAGHVPTGTGLHTWPLFAWSRARWLGWRPGRLSLNRESATPEQPHTLPIYLSLPLPPKGPTKVTFSSTAARTGMNSVMQTTADILKPGTCTNKLEVFPVSVKIPS